MAMPLMGLRVLEFGNGAVAADLCRILADFGAEVIHVESMKRPGGMRGRTPETANTSSNYVKSGRNKKSLSVDLKSTRGREVIKQLVCVTDVVVENWSVGVMKSWGLDYPRLKEIRPDIIMASLPALGSDGPHKDYVTWGPNLPPLAGVTYLWNHPNPPEPMGTQIFFPDFFSGIQGSCAILSAVNYRALTGRGQYISVAQVDMAAALIGPAHLDYTANGHVQQPIGNRSPHAAPHSCYRCKGEDRWCVIAVLSDEEWRSFCCAIGSLAWTEEERFTTLLGRLRNVEELDCLVEEWTMRHTPWEVMEILQRAGVAAGVVESAEDIALRDKHIRERGFLVEVDQPQVGKFEYEGVQVKLSDTPGSVYRRAPLLGEHTEYVCRDILGMQDEEIGELVEQGVLV